MGYWDGSVTESTFRPEESIRVNVESPQVPLDDTPLRNPNSDYQIDVAVWYWRRRKHDAVDIAQWDVSLTRMKNSARYKKRIVHYLAIGNSLDVFSEAPISLVAAL